MVNTVVFNHWRHWQNNSTMVFGFGIACVCRRHMFGLFKLQHQRFMSNYSMKECLSKVQDFQFSPYLLNNCTIGTSFSEAIVKPVECVADENGNLRNPESIPEDLMSSYISYRVNFKDLFADGFHMLSDSESLGRIYQLAPLFNFLWKKGILNNWKVMKVIVKVCSCSRAHSRTRGIKDNPSLPLEHIYWHRYTVPKFALIPVHPFCFVIYLCHGMTMTVELSVNIQNFGKDQAENVNYKCMLMFVDKFKFHSNHKIALAVEVKPFCYMKFTVHIKKKMWYDCQWDNYPQKTKMTQTLTTIGHRMAFNNEQSPYRIVSHKRPR